MTQLIEISVESNALWMRPEMTHDNPLYEDFL